MSDLGFQVVAGIFRDENGYANALRELYWSVGQNPGLWGNAVLYVDPDCERDVARVWRAFGHVIVDDDMPETVRKSRKWNCKGWWARRAVERFGEVLWCDFDVVMTKRLDRHLAEHLAAGPKPRLLHMPNYRHIVKRVGCGCAYYDRTCDWDRFLPLLYDKWRCDERAWSEAIGLPTDEILARGYFMNPWIVNWDWLLAHPEARTETYLVHGLSDVTGGWRTFEAFGFPPDQIRFRVSWRARLNHILTHALRRRGTTPSQS